ncbi:Ribosomal large subunit pseudouridine synthase E [Roseivivax sp. THAF40]|uniref:pseudouridine synthase n=1 Tax=unclassified Roseivivax TaxID=2639302 RepID=UPI001267C0EA|nr:MULTISPECIES: pseudouridine synthase [unclassified Roseivivax]QFS81564.1 Ribosomal large subunit pseudouridine synthase E [Roseivivax sp. THAF197b]QFT45293.1 Ribosomal large subunit pseudouridine synthase E [Roseivivax sp. THAF40]
MSPHPRKPPRPRPARRRVILFNKPFGCLSQFTDKGTAGNARATLSDFIDVPDVYPAGRLDRDSEGLLILTNDGKLQAQIASPKFKRPKTYLAQVEGTPGPDQIAALAAGVTLKDGPTRPAKVGQIPPPDLWERDPPVRYRKTVPDGWLEITLTEGRNRQVRRMCAAVGLPCLRLVRWQVGDWTLADLTPGAWRDG